MENLLKSTAAASVFAASPIAAYAHPGLHAAGFADGFVHPFTGADHLLAMVAAGYWAGQLSPRARLVVPAAFAVLMALGAALGFHAQAPAVVEYGIAASVAVMGLLIAFNIVLPVAPAAGLVGLFALFHGFAHGAEAPAAVAETLFLSGLAAASLALQGAGIGLAALRPGAASARLAGAAVALGGLWLLASA